MGNKNTIIQFVRDKGFYIALAVCIVGASAAAWATASRTLDSIEKNNRQIVEQGISGEEKPSWSSSSAAASSRGAEESRQNISSIEKPPASSTSAPSSSSASAPSSVSETAAAAPEPLPDSPTFAYTLPLEGGKVLNPYSGGQLVKNKTLNVWRTHDAVDIQGEKGARVYAIGNDALWGGVVQIDHPDGRSSVYSGLVTGERIKAGTEVLAGEELGTLGDIPAEISAEPHLHLALTREGKAVDPAEVLTFQ